MGDFEKIEAEKSVRAGGFASESVASRSVGGCSVPSSNVESGGYLPEFIELKWQKIWDEREIFGLRGEGEKRYVLVMFPYPSGKIHMGHVRNYSIGDAIARYMMMKGYDVLHPIGWDAFGLPAENAALEHGIHPAKWTYENISYMKRQLKRLGISYDWKREITTCSPEYYRWEQLFFIQMFKKGIAYRKMSFVNFCVRCNTVLANEQVIAGRCWRCNTQIIKKRMWGWFLKITDYAEELLRELDNLDWPERVKKMQREWIGKSYGAKIIFPLADGRKIEIFTTRPDTVFGVTFMALAPEHELAVEVAVPERKKDVEKFCDEVLRMSKEERGQELVGVFTGAYALNPFTQEKVPIWVANYVLPDYGTGAIMAVPAHDQRDFNFAKKYGISIKPVIVPYDTDHDFSLCAFEGRGKLINSGKFTGLDSEDAKNKITDFARERGFGDFVVSYRLRDWGISRQRYWGAPIPIIYCPNCGIVPEKEENLPITLPPHMEDMIADWKKTKCPYCGAGAERETDTMDTFVESSWYFLGYLSGDINGVDFSGSPFNPEFVRRYMPVDMYIGGIEHAVLHLLYARFFTKVLRDLGWIDISEPFRKLITQGMVIKDGAKMSKSKGNVVDPDDIVALYGADTVRVFILFTAPVEKDLEWSDRGVVGSFRFLRRVWDASMKIYDIVKERIKFDSHGVDSKIIDEENIFLDVSEHVAELRRAYAHAIVSVDKDIPELGFNTAIARLMEFTNKLEDFLAAGRKCEKYDDALAIAGMMKGFLKALSIFAPHIAEELWFIMQKEFAGVKSENECRLILDEGWVQMTEKLSALLYSDMVVIPVQVNGKVRGEIRIPRDIDEKFALEEARKNSRISKYIEGKEIKKIVFVKGKILNIVVHE